MASWKKALGVFLIYYAVLFIGAAIIMYIEANALRSEPLPKNVTEPLVRLLEKELNVSVNSSLIEKVIEISQNIGKQLNEKKDREWKTRISWSSLYKWRYFTHITLTTLGYGDIVPETDGGKIFVIIYGTIGIPVNIIFITTIGSLLSELFQKLIKETERRILRIETVKHTEIKTSIVLLLFCVSWLAIGAYVNTSVMDWSWTEGFYAAFVRVSTIGYGDYKLAFDKVKWYGELISWYTNVGLALAAGVFDALSTLMQPKKNKGKNDEKKSQKAVELPCDNQGKINAGYEMQSKAHSQQFKQSEVQEQRKLSDSEYDNRDIRMIKYDSDIEMNSMCNGKFVGRNENQSRPLEDTSYNMQTYVVS